MSASDRPEPDDLVVRAALGEALDEQERRRLAEDPDLQAEVDAFARVVEVASNPAGAGDPAPDHLWPGIAAAAFGDVQQDDDAAGGEVVQLRSRARWGMPLAAFAAAAALVAVVVVTGDPVSDDVTPVAAATLQPLEGAEVQVEAPTAQFVVDDGSTRLDVDLSALPDSTEGFYEIWLLDPDDGRMVSLGPARPDGTYALPKGVGVDDYPAVDVSVEPHDGDPTHSGDSVLRGSVTT